MYILYRQKTDKKSADDAHKLHEKYAKEKAAAKKRYEKEKAAYVKAQKEQTRNQEKVTMANNEYSISSSEYSAEKNKLMNYEQKEQSLKAEMKMAKKQMNSKKEAIRESFETTKASTVKSLEQELSKLTENMEKTDITAGQDGIVQEILVSDGAVVNQGSEVIRIRHGVLNRKEVVCYIPIASGIKVRADMKAKLYPTFVNSQEYGHMSGVVKGVEYASSREQIAKRLGSRSLAESFMQNGPVICVTCVLDEDAETASGYKWSGKKGAEVEIVDGTMFSVSIVTEEKAPITLLIPYLKEKLTVKSGGKEG